MSSYSILYILKDGSDGSPGSPGISLWQVKGSKPDRILIPPRISGGPYDSDQVTSIIFMKNLESFQIITILKIKSEFSILIDIIRPLLAIILGNNSSGRRSSETILCCVWES